jgi:hypothetical protein
LRWLIVKSGGERPTSITEFFAMNVGRFGEEGQKQLQVFGDIVDRKMQNAWASPQVRSMNMLEKFVDLIPPIIRQHYEDIVAGGIGYQGYRRAVLQVQGGIGKLMCHVRQEGTTEVDFQFDAEEGSSKTRLLKSVSLVCGLLTAGGVAPGTMTHHGQMWSIERYSSRYRSGWQAFTLGPQYSCFQRAYSSTRTSRRCLHCLQSTLGNKECGSSSLT